MQKVVPFLWFNTEAEEAMNYYASIFPDSKVLSVMPGQDGKVLTERAGRTTYTATMLYPTQAVRDAALDLKPAWKGAGEGFDRLEELLAEIA